MVAPNDDFGDVTDGRSCFFCDLPDGPIVVETGHGCAVFLGEVFGGGGGDEGVGVGGVADDEGSDVSVGVVVEGFSLGDEDFGVFEKEISSFLSFSSRFGADEEGGFYVLESWMEGGVPVLRLSVQTMFWSRGKAQSPISMATPESAFCACGISMRCRMMGWS